jgi:2-succinyl-6-hydroxy-2,4-cyclohexadiene-1-carboxylate synthase
VSHAHQAGPLHVALHGAGPPLVLLHGFTQTGRSLRGLAGLLGGRYETLAPDLPGHGRSAGAAALGFDAAVQALVATLEAAGHRRAPWLGYSMGARLALGCAVRRPGSVSALVLLGGRAGIADAAERAARRRDDAALAARIEAGGMAAFVDEWLAQPMFDPLRRCGPGVLEKQRRDRLGQDAHAVAESLRNLGPGAQPPLFEALPRVSMPVLLVAGALDRRFVALARELAALLPQAEVREIADAGHAAHLEQPQAFARIVLEFLARATAPAPSSGLHSVEETVP